MFIPIEEIIEDKIIHFNSLNLNIKKILLKSLK